jgi:hypothetical protein
MVSGYQPPKTDKPKAQYPPKGSGVPITADAEALKVLTELLKNNPDGFYTIETITTLKPSDLELRIRKDVLDIVNKYSERRTLADQTENRITMTDTDFFTIKDRLNLLWSIPANSHLAEEVTKNEQNT